MEAENKLLLEVLLKCHGNIQPFILIPHLLLPPPWGTFHEYYSRSESFDSFLRNMSRFVRVVTHCELKCVTTWTKWLKFDKNESHDSLYLFSAWVSHLNSRMFHPGVVFILCVGHCWDIMEVIKCFFYLVYGIKSHLQEPRPHLGNGRIQAVTKKKKKNQWTIQNQNGLS